MYVAHLASIAGDQIAKVSLAILVYDRTSSAALSSLVYALTFLPWLGAPLLASFGDRYRRRDVLVVCDAARAALVVVMILPGMPLAAMLVLLAGVSFLAPPFEAARSALLADVLTGRRYVVATTLSQMSIQGGQVIGFVAGGAIVGALSARGALAVDAATFALSAALLVASVANRPAAAPDPGPEMAPEPAPGHRAAGHRAAAAGPRWNDGLVYVLTNPTLRVLILLAWVVVFFTIAPEGLAVALAATHGGSDLAVGVLTAAGPLGVFLGALVVGRTLALERQLAAMLPLAVLATAPLCLTAFVPGLAGLVVLWVVAGLGLAFNLPANAAFVRAVANEMRSRAFGVAQAGLQVSQAAGLLLAGVAADHAAPASVVSVMGAGGLIAVGGLWLAWPRTNVTRATNRE